MTRGKLFQNFLLGGQGRAAPDAPKSGNTLSRSSNRQSILVLCPFPVGKAAGQRLKYEQYLNDWRAAGYDVHVRAFMDDALWSVVHQPGHIFSKVAGTGKGYLRRIRQLQDVGNFDVVYLFHWITPFGWGGIEKRLRRHAKRLIFDIEDNVLAASGGGEKPSPLASCLRGQAKARYLVREADYVIASSPELAHRCSDLNRKGAACYISSSVDTSRHVPAQHKNSAKVVIGWTGTISSRPYLDRLRPVFVSLAALRPFRLRVIGNFDYSLPGIDLEVLRWNAVDEVEQLQGIDIGVYPLPNDDWVGGKSGLKAIQYAAMGVPCVASNVGHTPKIVEDEITGILVSDCDEQWIKALTRLIDDSELRNRMGRSARERAVEHYSLPVIGRDYRRVIEHVMGSAPRDASVSTKKA